MTYLHLLYLFVAIWLPILRSLPVSMPTPGEATFTQAFGAHLALAAIPEELMKAVPILLALLLAVLVPRAARGPAAWFSLRGPLDGVLMGVASALGFTLMETNNLYVGGLIRAAESDPKLGAVAALLLAMPRYLNSFGLHAGCSAIFGYFIGLAASHRAQAGRLILAGWVISSLLHGLWNAVAYTVPLLLVAVGILTTLLFAATLLKARQLDAPRLLAAGAQGSILAPPPPLLPPAAVPPPPTGPAAVLSSLVRGIEKGVGVTAQTTVPRAIDLVPLAIGTEMARYALAPSAGFALSSLFADIPAGPAAAVETRPDGRLVIRNQGTEAWTAIHRGGLATTIRPGETMEAVEGTHLTVAGRDLAITRA